MKIKVCGMREADNIREVENLLTLNSKFSTIWMGFIFWPKSSRYVSEVPSYLPTKCKRVGVFVDASIDDIRQHIADYGLDMVQLHGHESPDYIRQLGSVCGDAITIIKALNIATTDDLEKAEPYEGIADYLLFDTKGKSVGGNGEKFDWSVLESYHGETPFLLSGGIGPDDAERVKKFSHPRYIGIDLNSRFESSPALKDIEKLKKFLNYE
jgi:phosphoribosylanthranilate isomerase